MNPEPELEILRNAKTKAAVHFIDFTNMRAKFTESLFCCFEGDDAKYYFKRIEDQTGYSVDKIIPFNCQGKSQVLLLNKMIKKENINPTVKVLFFIDRDFDESIKGKIDGIYETPVYSIENFYTTLEAFIRILKIEFNYAEMDKEFGMLISLFIERQKEFHAKTLLLNAWIACERKKSDENSISRLNLSDFNLNKLVKNINLDFVDSNYTLDTLKELFPKVLPINDEEINAKIEEFQKEKCQEIFRGKFEIDFLHSFLEAIKIEYNKPKSRLTKKYGVQLNQSKKNIIAEFSNYATTNSCLIDYLKPFKVA